MKLAALLGTIAVAWCVLGAIILGPGILLYPAAWGAVLAVLYGIHKALQFHHDSNGSRAVSAGPARATHTDLSHDRSTAVLR